jgi:hypothetical protein
MPFAQIEEQEEALSPVSKDEHHLNDDDDQPNIYSPYEEPQPLTETKTVKNISKISYFYKAVQAPTTTKASSSKNHTISALNNINLTLMGHQEGELNT